MMPKYPAARPLPSYENLLLEMVEPNILKVTLNRPKAYNALSHGLVQDLIVGLRTDGSVITNSEDFNTLVADWKLF